jgi:tRNA-dihydrouridine synthase A
MTEESGVQICLPIAVAPMMDWTDRHCRYFLRQLSPSAMLYTEMVTAAAIHHGDYEALLRFDQAEHAPTSATTRSTSTSVAPVTGFRAASLVRA